MASKKPIKKPIKKRKAALLIPAEPAMHQETLNLVSIPSMRESIMKGMKTPARELARKLNW